MDFFFVSMSIPPSSSPFPVVVVVVVAAAMHGVSVVDLSETKRANQSGPLTPDHVSPFFPLRSDGGEKKIKTEIIKVRGDSTS